MEGRLVKALNYAGAACVIWFTCEIILGIALHMAAPDLAPSRERMVTYLAWISLGVILWYCSPAKEQEFKPIQRTRMHAHSSGK